MEPMIIPSSEGGLPQRNTSFGGDVVQRLFGVLVGIVLINVLWVVLELFDSDIGRPGEGFWPSHADAFSEFRLLVVDGFQGETLFSHTGATLLRVAASVLLALVIGGGLGAAMGSQKTLRNLLDPFVSFMRLFTPGALVSLSLLFLGLGERNIILTTGFVCTWIVADGVARTMVADGSSDQTVDQLVQLARTVLLAAWIVVAFSEIIGSANGLGSAIWTARTFFRTGMMLTIGLWSTLLFLAADYSIRLVGRLLRQQ